MTPLTSSTSLLVTASSFITGTISFILEVALLVVALTVVRKRRADAGALIAASAGLQLVLTVVSPIAYAIIARIAGSGATWRCPSFSSSASPSSAPSAWCS